MLNFCLPSACKKVRTFNTLNIMYLMLSSYNGSLSKKELASFAIRVKYNDIELSSKGAKVFVQCADTI